MGDGEDEKLDGSDNGGWGRAKEGRYGEEACAARR